MIYKSINSTNCVDNTTIILDKLATRFAVLGSFVRIWLITIFLYIGPTGKHRLALYLM